MNLKEFLSAVADIKALNPRYRLGRTGDDGYCDCIGLIIGAAERCGAKWDGVHGSNWWARHYTASLMRVTEAADLSLGDLVYKARAPGASGYSLPDRYKDDPDRLDYYHVGVVTGVNPLKITHCTSGGGVDGITVDTKLGKWSYKGQLTLLDDRTNESEVDEMMGTKATVYAENGGDVNFRKRPSTSGALIQRVPVGQEVTVVSQAQGWAQIVVGGVVGYMMDKYLRFADAEGVEDQGGDELAELVKRLDELEERVAALEGGVG